MLQSIQIEDLIDAVTSKRRVAEKRSGERGLLAREELIRAEKELECERGRTHEELIDKFTGKVTTSIQELIHLISERLKVLEIDTAEHRAREILTGSTNRVKYNIPYTLVFCGHNPNIKF